MASLMNLEERFNKAVKTIQNLPSDGIIKPSNLTKLIFYGLYKQATLGPCQEPQPSMFNYIARAKWEGWDRCRAMTKEQAMLAYIDEIRKIVETMPQTNEVLEFAKSMGLYDKSVDDRTKVNDSVVPTENLPHETTDNHSEQPPVNTNDPIETIVSAGNSSAPASSSSSSSSSSSITSSDIDEFYDDPSDLLSLEMASNNNFQQQSINTTRLPHSPHVYGGQNGINIPVRHSTRGGNTHSNVSSTRSPSFRQYDLSNGAQYSTSSGGDNSRYPANNYSKENQRAILTALTKLQRDINNILERLNRLETSGYLLQQRELSMSLELKSSSKWFPLSGFRRETIAFILFWPFIAYILIRLILRAKIIIRFRR